MTVRLSQSLSVLVSLAILLTFPMMSLAAGEKVVGEISISGKLINGQAPAVTVNGEVAQSGRAILSGSTISTSTGSTATLGFGKLGTIELAPNSSAVVSFSEKGISGDLLSGKVTVLNAPENSVSFKTSVGASVLNAGQSASTSQDDDDAAAMGNGGGAAWWWAAILIGGAAAGIFIAANTDNNRVALGGGTTIVSPTR